MKYKDFYEKVQKNVALKDSEFTAIKDDLMNKFEKEYHGEKI